MVLALICASGVQAERLEDVMQRGALRCGVNPNLPGFAVADSLGRYAGFDVDICRAVAMAVLGDADAVQYRPLDATERFSALASDQIDMLSRNTTWTLDRNVRVGAFTGTVFYDGQGFMVPVRSGIHSALELDAQPLCVLRNTTSELNAKDWFAINRMRSKFMTFDDADASRTAYAGGNCTVLTGDRSSLAAQRSALMHPAHHRILPEIISKEPLGPVVRHGDAQWENVVRWSVNCMINAEELGVHSANVNDFGLDANPAIRRLLGLEGESGAALGLRQQWCRGVIAVLGNFGELYARHLGEQTPLNLPRGVNALWTDGGLIYAPPLR